MNPCKLVCLMVLGVILIPDKYFYLIVSHSICLLCSGLICGVKLCSPLVASSCTPYTSLSIYTLVDVSSCKVVFLWKKGRSIGGGVVYYPVFFIVRLLQLLSLIEFSVLFLVLCRVIAGYGRPVVLGLSEAVFV